MGARRFSGLGLPPSNGTGGVPVSNGFEFDGDEVGSGFSAARVGTAEAGGGVVSAEEASGHLYAGFGEGLTTKSPVVYFAKTKHTGGDDCKAPIDAYQASFYAYIVVQVFFKHRVRAACSCASCCPHVLVFILCLFNPPTEGNNKA